jgi:hypothetical protein
MIYGISYQVEKKFHFTTVRWNYHMPKSSHYHVKHFSSILELPSQHVNML